MLAAGPEVATGVRESLEPHRESLTPKLWTVVDAAKSDDVSLLPAASAWQATTPQVPGGNPWAARWLKPWSRSIRFTSVPGSAPFARLRTKLNTPLASVFLEKGRPDSEHALATSILIDYASDDPDLIASLLMDADPKAYASFFPLAQRHETRALPLFQAEIANKATIPDSDKDSETVKDRLAERQARAAVALLRMGKAGEVMPLLRHSADPRLRSFIVNWLNPLGADPKPIATELARLDSARRGSPDSADSADRRSPDPAALAGTGRPLVGPEARSGDLATTGKMDAVLFHPETSQRRALILALGTYGTEGLAFGEREPLTGKLLDLYRNEPDSGIHGAAEWTLRQWKQQEKLKELDAELMKVKDRGERRWFVNSQGQTFAVIEGPVEFRMGSPPNEPGRDDDEGAPPGHDSPSVRHRRPGGDGRAVSTFRENQSSARALPEHYGPL